MEHKNENEAKIPPKLLVLGVMVPGKDYADRCEWRIRYRFAVTNGMAESGYAPCENEYMDYFVFQPRQFEESKVPASVMLAFRLMLGLHDAISNPMAGMNLLRLQWNLNINSETLRVPDSDKSTRFENKSSSTNDFQCFFGFPFSDTDEKTTASKIDVPPAETINIPFEWFAVDEGIKKHRVDPLKLKYDYVLVVWLDEDHFEKQPLYYLLQLKDKLDSLARTKIGQIKSKLNIHWPKNNDWGADWNVLGPWSSAVLNTMHLECETSRELHQLMDDPTKERKADTPVISFYNVTATFQQCEHGMPHEEVLEVKTDRVKMCKVKPIIGRFPIYHLITNDNTLGHVIFQELELRKPPLFSSESDKIVIIGEHDTQYGRHLLNIIEDHLAESGHEHKASFQFEYYTYLRGLDGFTMKSGDESKNQLEKKDAIKQARENLLVTKKSGNPPEGNNQYDYVVRLASEIKTGTPSPFAIGVMGSDLYDKLILLQELKKHFPNAVFFTTDLDASYLNARELSGTRNLIVASSHGLKLNAKYQGKVPPFRSSYQTAMFQGVLAIMRQNDPSGDTLRTQSPPRLFEIGWSGANDLSINAGKDISCASSLHPPVRPSLFDLNVPGILWWTIAVTICGFILSLSLGCHRILIRVFRGDWLNDFARRKKDNKTDGKAPSNSTGFYVFFMTSITLLLILFVACLIIVISFCHYWTQYGGEPFYLFEGVSVWPTIIVHIFTTLLGIGFLIGIVHRMRKTEMELAELFTKRKKTEQPEKNKKKPPFFKRCCRYCLAGYHYILMLDVKNDNKCKNVRELWDYHSQHFFARMSFVVVNSVIMFVALVPLLCHSTSWSSYRGNLGMINISFWAGFISWFVACGVLIFISVIVFTDAFICGNFIRRLSHIHDDSSGVFQTDQGNGEVDVKKESLEWNKIRLVSIWTGGNNALLLMPAVLLFFLIAARIPLFDNHGTADPMRILFMLTIFALFFLPVFMLRRAASHLRKDCIQKLRIRNLLQKDRKRDKNYRFDDEQIAILIKEIEDYHVGIFSNYWHPIIPFMILISGGSAFPIIIDYFIR